MARVHPVYLDWCRIFSKEPNDSRFATFASNYIKQENAKAREGDKAEAESVAKAEEEARLAAEAVANAEEEARLAAEALNLENEARQRLAEKEAKEGAERAARIAAEEARLRDIAGKHYAANQVVRYETIFLTDFTLQPQLKREQSVLKALMTQKKIRRTVYVYVRFIGNFAKFMAKRLMNLNSAHLNLITL